MITIFTATYNRGELLNRLYESLRRQSCLEFEWVLVDDASTDETERIISRFKSDLFPIIFKKQVHGGKHRAINKGLEIAKGDFFYIVDDDDYLPDDSIEIICSWLTQIDDDIVGVAGLRILPDGTVCGGKPQIEKTEYVDATNFERKKYNLLGDKAEVYKTSVMKRHVFPEFEDEYFVTENVCWDAIAAEGGKVRWYNKPIYICEYQSDGLTGSGANDYLGHKDNFKGYCFYVKQSLHIKPNIESARVFREYDKTCNQMTMTFKAKAFSLEMTIIEYFFYWLFKMPFYCSLRIISDKISKFAKRFW